MTNKKTTAITIRIDDDLLTSFKTICEREGYSQSLIIRELMKSYVRKNGQGDLFGLTNAGTGAGKA